MKFIRAMAMIVVFFLSGCAAFSGNVLPKVSSFPVVSEKPSASVNLSFRQYVNDQPINILVKTTETNLQKKIVERFEKSGMYSSVAQSNPNSDITVDVEMKDDGRGSMGMAVLTGLSLYIIPSSSTDTWKVSTKVKNNRNGSEDTIELEDFVTQWQQILLLPLLPFCLTPVVSDGVINNIMDTLAIRVHEVASGKISAKQDTSENVKNNDTLKRLKNLKEAFESGLISKADYESKKAEIMMGL